MVLSGVGASLVGLMLDWTFMSPVFRSGMWINVCVDVEYIDTSMA